MMVLHFVVTDFMVKGSQSQFYLQSVKMIEFLYGSLFTADKAHSLAQCISGDTRVGMFRGIAVEFMKLYPELRELRWKGDQEVGTIVPVKSREKNCCMTQPDTHYLFA